MRNIARAAVGGPPQRPSCTRTQNYTWRQTKPVEPLGDGLAPEKQRRPRLRYKKSASVIEGRDSERMVQR